MSKMSEMDSLISDLRSAAETINGVADVIFRLVSSAEEPLVPTAEASVQHVLTLPEVRAVLAEKSRAGYTAQVRELLLKHGSDKLSGIDPSEYSSLLAEAEVLGDG